MPPLRSLIVSLVPLLVGMVAHIRGLSVSDATKADTAQTIGLAFDVLTVLVFFVLKIQHDGLDSVYKAMQAHMNDPAGHTDDAVQITVASLETNSPKVAKFIKTGGPTRGNNDTIRPVLSLVVLLGALLVGGCQPGQTDPFSVVADPKALPAQRITAAETIYNSTMTALILLRQDKVLDDATWHNIRVASDAFNAALDSLKSQTAAGVPLDNNSLWTAANAALLSLVNEKGSPHGGTNPGTRNYRGPAPNLRTDPGEQQYDDRRARAGDYRPAA